MTLAISDEKRREIDMEVKLHINKQLFEKGYITEEMYQKANDMILKSCNRLSCVI